MPDWFLGVDEDKLGEVQCCPCNCCVSEHAQTALPDPFPASHLQNGMVTTEAIGILCGASSSVPCDPVKILNGGRAQEAGPSKTCPLKRNQMSILRSQKG